MKIGFMADSHDSIPALVKVVGIFNDAGAKFVLHAGDLISPFVSKPIASLKAEFKAVFGNNDGEKQGLLKVFENRIFRPPHALEIGKRRILLMHEPDQIDALVKSQMFDIIIYGHTHEPVIKKGATLVVNPGECCGYLSGKRTVALLDTDKNDVQIIL